jgi:hypothetical protein
VLPPPGVVLKLPVEKIPITSSVNHPGRAGRCSR